MDYLRFYGGSWVYVLENKSGEVSHEESLDCIRFVDIRLRRISLMANQDA